MASLSAVALRKPGLGSERCVSIRSFPSGSYLICGTSAFELEGDTLSAELSCQSQTISIVADVAFEGRVALLWSGHIHGDGANTLGGAALLSLIRWAMEFLDVDELRIAGAPRTSGANPGHTPRLLVFRHD
jgi:hypothetical protein